MWLAAAVRDRERDPEQQRLQELTFGPPACSSRTADTAGHTDQRGRSEAEARQERKQTEHMVGFILPGDSAPDDTVC